MSMFAVALLLSWQVQANITNFTNFYFTSEQINLRCEPDVIDPCEDIGVCSFETSTQRYFCCEFGWEDAGCWNNARGCEDNGDAGPDQQKCNPGHCCHKSDTCTDVLNICAHAEESLQRVPRREVVRAYSALSSASPSASTWSFDLEAILATLPPGTTSATTSTSLFTTPATTLSSSFEPSLSSDTSTLPPTNKPSSSPPISGGKIGGIVVGGIGVLAIIGAILLFLVRRKRSSTSKPELTSNFRSPRPSQEKYPHEGSSAVVPEAKGPVELVASSHQPSEMLASVSFASEMDPQSRPSEMQVADVHRDRLAS